MGVPDGEVQQQAEDPRVRWAQVISKSISVQLRGHAVRSVHRPRGAEPDAREEEEEVGGGGSINIVGVGPDIPPHQDARWAFR